MIPYPVYVGQYGWVVTQFTKRPIAEAVRMAVRYAADVPGGVDAWKSMLDEPLRSFHYYNAGMKK